MECLDDSVLQPVSSIVKEDIRERCGNALLNCSQESMSLSSSDNVSIHSEESMVMPFSDTESMPSQEITLIHSPHDQPLKMQQLADPVPEELSLQTGLQTPSNTPNTNPLHPETGIQTESLFSSMFRKTKAFITSIFHPFSFYAC